MLISRKKLFVKKKTVKNTSTVFPELGIIKLHTLVFVSASVSVRQ